MLNPVCPHLILEVGLFQSLPHLSVFGKVKWVNVEPDGSLEQHRVLGDHCDGRPQGLQSNATRILVFCRFRAKCTNKRIGDREGG